jgi:hypothetical protein
VLLAVYAILNTNAVWRSASLRHVLFSGIPQRVDGGGVARLTVALASADATLSYRTCQDSVASNYIPLGNMNYVMGAAMPFSRYKIADSGLMEAMRAAFHQVCEVLQLSCDREDP